MTAVFDEQQKGKIVEKKPFQMNTKVASYVVLALAIIVSSYLSYLKLDNTPAVCIEGSVFDCGTVLNSVYSELAGIPIAWLGLGLNLIILALLFLEDRIPFLQENGIMIEFGFVLIAFLFSMYLIYVQAVLIQAYCPWCLSHEAFITILFGLTVSRLMKMINGTDVAEEAVS